jgi:hypothetical protein
MNMDGRILLFRTEPTVGDWDCTLFEVDSVMVMSVSEEDTALFFMAVFSYSF